VSLGLQYEYWLGDSVSFIPREDSSYTTPHYSRGVNALTHRIAPYGMINARSTWRNGKGDWEAALEGTNLTDTDCVLSRFDQYSSTGVTCGPPGRPREFAITLRRKVL
jgi:iron complex outermembrane receptor protein